MNDGGKRWGEETSEERREQACWDRRRQKERETEVESEGFETKVTARCDKGWLKSLSRSEPAGGVQCLSLLFLSSALESHQHSDYKSHLLLSP